MTFETNNEDVIFLYSIISTQVYVANQLQTILRNTSNGKAK